MSSFTSDVFFYGLFMDPATLEAHGVRSNGSRLGLVRDWSLCIGQRATIVPTAGGVVYGIITTMRLPDVDRLYRGASVQMYRPAAVLVEGLAPEDRGVAALVYVLPEQQHHSDYNSEYAAQLQALTERLGFPTSYTESIA